VAALLIRKAKVEDAERIIKYTKQVGGESDNLTFGADDFSRTKKEQERLISELNEEENGLILLGLAEGELVSVVTFSRGRTTRIRHYGEIGVTVSATHQGRGIGRRMMVAAMERLEKSGIEKINLKVRCDHERAITLYTSLGFVVEGRITRYFKIGGHHHDVFVMGKEVFSHEE
jgi:ribosomal protein S18 acetylase RimI-like enzyme